MSNELTELYLALLDFIEPLRTRLEQRDALEYLFYRYGWDATMDDAAFARFQQAATIIAPIEQFTQTAEALRTKLETGTGLGPADIEALAGSAAVLIKALAEFGMPDLAGLADPLDRPEFWESIAEQVFDDLLEQYLRVHQRMVFIVLRLWNVIRYDPTGVTGPGRVPYTRVWFDWDQAAGMLTDPLQALKRAYHWGDATQPFDYEGALEALRLAFAALRLPAAQFAPALVTAPIPGDAARSAPEDVLALRVTLLERDFPDQSAFYRLGLEVYPALRSTDQVPAGLMLKPILEGGAGATLPLNSLLSFSVATVLSADDAIGLALFPGEVGLVAGAPAVGASLALQTTGTGPWYAIGNAQTSHIELSGFLLRASVEGSADDPEFKLEMTFAGAGGAPGAKAVVNLSGADTFVQGTVDRDALTFSFAPDIVWSSRTGLTFGGKTAPALTLPLSIPLGPIALTDATVALGAAPQTTTSSHGVALRVGLGVAGSLGPIGFAIAQLGFACVFTPYSRDDVQALPGGAAPPALGAVDVDLQFTPPTGVGVSIDAGVVTGGGFLAHAGDEYGGALELAISDVTLKAYGLVQTQLPGGRAGYSLIVAISTEFSPPVELPFGFTLEGAGGLIGVNRMIDEDAVRSALWAHHLDGLLFPADPVAAAPRLLTALDSYFPGAQGRYVFGPLAKLGWGGLVDGEVALLLELPEPVKLLLIGEIQALVPSVAPQLRLHVSFDGGIDFGKKLAFFDASLHDSYITAYPISGDLAFRYGWGSDAALALALGGFNPHFQPPPGFPALKRLAITISSSVAQIQAQAYLALTSNTLQFGARVELTAGTGGFNVHGWLGFDALCERDPLSFEFDLSAGVDLRHGTDVLASVHLDGKLSGPAPWHISGDASISLLFFDVSVHFDNTWGDEAPQVAAPDPLPAVLAALCDRSGWSGALAASARAVVTTLGNPADAGDAVLLDPAGSLRIAQRAIPLGQPVTRFGGTPLGRTVQLTFDDLTVLGAAVTDPAPATEEFAPGQFLDLSDADRLSLPSFSPMDAGVEVGAATVDLGSGNRARAVATPFEYDTTIVDTQAQRPGTGYTIAETALLAFNARTQGAAPGLARYAPSAGAPPLVALAPERWVVAGTADLALHADVATDGSKLGTKLALGTYLAANPSAAGELQVVLAAEAA
jgi:hypothetical protein